MRKRKFAKKKESRPVFLVVCEGETEREYVEVLKLHYRLPVAIKTKVSGNKISRRLLDQYVAELGMQGREAPRIFLVYDADVKPIVEKLKGLNGTLILSNPCVELWFILHSKQYRQQGSSAKIIKDLMNSDAIWANYQKGQLTGEQSKHLVSQTEVAVTNSRRLEWPENPSTNLWAFIADLEKAKNG